MYLHLGIKSQNQVPYPATVLLPNTQRIMRMTDTEIVAAVEYAQATGNIPKLDIPDILEVVRRGEDVEEENHP